MNKIRKTKLTIREKLELIKQVERRNEQRRKKFKRKNNGKNDAKQKD